MSLIYDIIWLVILYLSCLLWDLIPYLFLKCLPDSGPVFNQSMNNQSVGPDLQSGVLNKVTITSFGIRISSSSIFSFWYLILMQTYTSTNAIFSTALLGSQSVQMQKAPQPNLLSTSSGQHENWGESNMAESSSRTDTSTDLDPDDKNQKVSSSIALPRPFFLSSVRTWAEKFMSLAVNY